MRNKDWGGAIRELDHLLTTQPRHAQALHHKAICLAYLERRDEAAALATAARDLARDDQTRKGAEELLEQLKTYGVQLVLHQAIAKMKADDFASAGSLLDEAVRKYPGDASLWFHLAICRGKTGQFEPAKSAIARAEALPRDAALQASIEDVKQKLARVNGPAATPTRSQPAASTSKTRWQEALEDMEKENWKGAVYDLDQLLAREPRNPQALHHKAICLVKLGRIDEAKQAAAAARNHAGDDVRSREGATLLIHELAKRGPDIVAQVATKEMDSHEFESAANVLGEAVKAYPRDATLWYLRAVCEAKTGKLDAAKRSLASAEPTATPELRESIREMKDGIAQAKERIATRARLEKKIAEASERGAPWQQIAGMMFEEGEPESAMELVNRMSAQEEAKEKQERKAESKRVGLFCLLLGISGFLSMIVELALPGGVAALGIPAEDRLSAVGSAFGLGAAAAFCVVWFLAEIKHWLNPQWAMPLALSVLTISLIIGIVLVIAGATPAAACAFFTSILVIDALAIAAHEVVEMMERRS